MYECLNKSANNGDITANKHTQKHSEVDSTCRNLGSPPEGHIPPPPPASSPPAGPLSWQRHAVDTGSCFTAETGEASMQQHEGSSTSQPEV